MSTPIHIALCGKVPPMVVRFIELMRPEYEVVHHCNSVSTAMTELPAVLEGENVKPSTGFGSNAQAATSTPPRAIVVGGGFVLSEVEEMRTNDVLGAAVMLYPSVRNISNGGGPPAMEDVIARVKKTFNQIGLVSGTENDVKAGLYDY